MQLCPLSTREGPAITNYRFRSCLLYFLFWVCNRLVRVSMIRVKLVKSTHVSEQRTRTACVKHVGCANCPIWTRRKVKTVAIRWTGKDTVGFVCAVFGPHVFFAQPTRPLWAQASSLAISLLIFFKIFVGWATDFCMSVGPGVTCLHLLRRWKSKPDRLREPRLQ